MTILAHENDDMTYVTASLLDALAAAMTANVLIDTKTMPTLRNVKYLGDSFDQSFDINEELWILFPTPSLTEHPVADVLGSSNPNCHTPSENPATTSERLVSPSPTALPSEQLTAHPSMYPSSKPSLAQTPSSLPSTSPTLSPSALPSTNPSMTPSIIPSRHPTDFPSNLPSTAPSSVPTGLPSGAPTKNPSKMPSDSPSQRPSNSPSDSQTFFSDGSSGKFYDEYAK